MFTVSLSGTKEHAKNQVESQITSSAAERAMLKDLIDCAPGTHVSMSGSLNASSDGQSGSISLSGSFWTPTPTSQS